MLLFKYSKLYNINFIIFIFFSSIELPELSTPVIFPIKVPIQELPQHEFNFDDLDYITQEELKDMCNLDIITFIGK